MYKKIVTINKILIYKRKKFSLSDFQVFTISMNRVLYTCISKMFVRTGNFYDERN